MWALVRVEIVATEKYILKKYCRDWNRYLLAEEMWQGSDSINKDCKTDKYFGTKLQVSVRIKYNYVHENAL